MCPFIETAIAVTNAVKIISEVGTVANGIYRVTEALNEGDLMAIVGSVATTVAGSNLPLKGAVGTITKVSSEVGAMANNVFRVGAALNEGDLVEVVGGIAKTVTGVKLPDASGNPHYTMKLPDGSGASGYSMKLPDSMSLKPPTADKLGKRIPEPTTAEIKNHFPIPDWMDNISEASDRPTPRESELRALEIYGGSEQKSYKDGEEVPYGTPGSTRPDIVREVDSKIEAIEVKNYDLRDPERVEALAKELYRQIGQRVVDMPEGTLQRVVLDVRGQNLTQEHIDAVKEKILQSVSEVYPNLPIDTIND